MPKALLIILTGILLAPDVCGQDAEEPPTEKVRQLRSVLTAWAELSRARTDVLSMNTGVDDRDWEPMFSVKMMLQGAHKDALWLADLVSLDASADLISPRCDEDFVGSRMLQDRAWTANMKMIEGPANALVVRDALKAWRSAMDLMEEVCGEYGWEPPN